MESVRAMIFLFAKNRADNCKKQEKEKTNKKFKVIEPITFQQKI